MLRKINEMLNISLFPFKNLLFFKRDYFIDIVKYNDNKKKINDLMCTVRKDFIYKNHIRSIDEVELMMRKYHLDYLRDLSHESLNEQQEEMVVYAHYIDILEKFSSSLLSHRDGKIIYKYWKGENDNSFLGPYSELEKVHIFYSINKIISMDILTGIYFVNNGIVKKDNLLQLDGFFDTIELADRHLEKVLYKGVAENHIHASASFNFSLSWDAIMNGRVDGKYIKQLEMNEFADSKFENNAVWYLKEAYIKRLLMAWFLKEEGQTENNKTFRYWLKEKVNGDILLKEFLSKEGKEGKFSPELFSEIIAKVHEIFEMDWEERKDDLIFHIFTEQSYLSTYGENIFLAKAIQYVYKQIDLMKKNKSPGEGDFIHGRTGEGIPDSGFCKEFFQYIRIKNETYQQMVQGMNLNGLSFFQEYFKRSTSLIWHSSPSAKEYCKLMMRTLFQNEYLRKIELRISINDSEREIRYAVQNILRAYYEVIKADYKPESANNLNFPRIGIVFHLIKSKDSQPLDKCWREYDEYDEKTFGEIRFKNIQKSYEEKVRSIAKFRKEISYLSHFIIGLDAASNENNTPVQVFAPVYHQARGSSIDPLQHLDSNGRMIKNKSLGFTFHAGEDFRIITSGLRRVSEVIEKCKFRAGDRIGHATVLGIDIDKWAENNPVIMIPRGEHLDNLLWIWAIYTHVDNVDPKVIIYVEKNIYETAKGIFQNNTGITIPMLYDVYNRRFDEFKKSAEYMGRNHENDNCEKEKSFIDKPIFCMESEDINRVIWDSDKLIHSYNCRCYLKKIEEPIYVQTRDIDKIIMKEIRDVLIKRIAEKGIVVEVNPTSNAVIGEIEDVFHNQAFEINKISEYEKNIMFCINSDDPMVFNTTVSNEYAYLYYGLLYRGVCKEGALEWIDKTRKCGMASSFINDKLDSWEYYQYLKGALEELGVEIDEDSVN